MVKYLTREWFKLGMNAINADPEIREGAKNLTATFLHVVTEVPDRENPIIFANYFSIF